MYFVLCTDVFLTSFLWILSCGDCKVLSACDRSFCRTMEDDLHCLSNELMLYSNAWFMTHAGSEAGVTGSDAVVTT